MLKTGLPLIENVRKSLAKSVLIPLGLKKQNEAKEQKEGFPGMLLGTLFIIVIHLFQFDFTKMMHKIINYNMTN